LGLWTSEISNIKLHPSSQSFLFEGYNPLTACPVDMTIENYFGSLLGHGFMPHLSYIRWLRITSGFYPPRIHAMSPLDLVVYIYFESSRFDNIRSQLKPRYTLPRACDMLTSFLLHIDESRLFDYSGFECFNLSPLPSSRSHDPLTRTLLDITVEILFSSPALRTLGISSFKRASS
jgi:hypothetical protein